MSPIPQGVAGQLRQLIYYNLDNNNVRNALFLAGRLHGLEARSAEAAYLLAMCHLRLGELKTAYDYSRTPGSRGTHLGCAYVFAQTCLGLGKYGEGITALDKSRGLWLDRSSWNKHNETRRSHMPDAAAVYSLMGKLFQAHDEAHRAVDCYSAALKVNPFMWDAFQGLCDLGVNVRIPNVFKMTEEMKKATNVPEEEIAAASTIDDSPPLNVHQNPPTNIRHDPFNSVSIPQNPHANRNGKVPLYEKLNGSHASITPLAPTLELHGNDSFETPTNPAGAQGGSFRETRVFDESNAPDPPQAPARKTRIIPGLSNDNAVGAPARVKNGGLLSRPQSVTEPEDSEPSVPTWNPSGMADRKRTASGQVSKASFASTRNHVGAPSDVGSMAPQRRSVRLFNQVRPQSKYSDVGSIHKSMTSGKDSGRELKKAKATGTKATMTRQTAGRVVSGNRRIGDTMEVDERVRAIVPSGAPVTAAKHAQQEKLKEQEALRQLLDLFNKLGHGYFALSHYQNQEAYTIFSGLPTSHRQTPWVQAMMGRALFEQAKYSEAEGYFARARLLCPSRLDDLEIHSTVLWHLKAEVDLAHLAHEATDIDRTSPQAWIVLGNSLSLARDHEKALVAFTRATQLDPSFAYAFTLQGHEHSANEEYDKALSAYRAAMSADSRHYNAYYGIGRVLEKQGKYEEAERHYKIAVNINPTNSVLICCIGTVMEKLKRPQVALEYYARSCELAPKSTLSKFKKARLLMVMNRWEEALKELLILKDLASDEANVHFLLGRVYKTMRDKGSAIKHFTTALNLDPKVS